ISLLLLIFTILVNGYFYLYRGVLLSPSPSDTQAAQDMVPYILTGLGLEVSAVSPFALFAVVEGASSICSLLLWITEIACYITGALASFLPHVLDVIGIRVCGMSVYQTFRKPVDCPLPMV